MERSGWFDDDDESSPRPPPEDRVWRHPSELGAHGAYGAPARRRPGLRFAGALALGSAGTLVFAVLTSMQLFGGQLDRGGALGPGEESSLFSVTAATTSLVRRTSLPPTASQVATTESTAPVVVTTRPVTSMPPKVGVRVGGAEGTVPAVIDDDGYVLTGTDDLAGATEGEVVLDDGSRVGVTVESVDRASGVTRLKPDRKVPVPENQTMAWLGVTCSDDTATAGDASAPTTATPEPTTTSSSPATAAPATDRTVASVVSTVPAPSTAAPASTVARTAAATSAAATSATTSTAASTSTTADDRPRVVATSVPVTSAASPSAGEPADGPTRGPSGAAEPPLTGVRVHRVHPDSPAAAAGVLEGDLILAVDDKAVHSRWALVLAVRRHDIGEQVRVEILRDGTRLAFDVVLAAGPTA